MFANTLGRKRLFTPMNSFSAKIRESVAGFCVNRSMASAVWHTNAFILSGYKGNYMMPSVFFVATSERNATATQKELLW